MSELSLQTGGQYGVLSELFRRQSALAAYGILHTRTLAIR